MCSKTSHGKPRHASVQVKIALRVAKVSESERIGNESVSKVRDSTKPLSSPVPSCKMPMYLLHEFDLLGSISIIGNLYINVILILHFYLSLSDFSISCILYETRISNADDDLLINFNKYVSS